MDKRQLTDLITRAFNSLTPIRVSPVFRDEETIEISVVSNQFVGMTFSARFKLLDKIVSDRLPDLHSNHLMIYEAFTKEEAEAISKEKNDKKNQKNSTYRKSAKELEQP